MADILIRGMEMPKDGRKHTALLQFLEDGKCRGIVEYSKSYDDRSVKVFEVVPLPEGHGNLIEQKALNLFPDYKEVRNGIKRTIKEAERDGRVITGVSIDLLKQTLVALDSLRSVRKYFLNAKTIVPAEGDDNE